MPTPHTSDNFGDLLDPRFQEIFSQEREQLPDMLPEIFGFPADNGRADMRWSSVGAAGDVPEFTGQVSYDTTYQGYDTLQTHVEFASGMQVERKLFDDDQYNVMDNRARALALSDHRTRQKYGARIFNNAFSVDNFFYTNTEGVALCSDSHTTTASGVSTSSGFDNKLTSALSAVAVQAARIQFRKFRDDRGNLYESMPDELLIPIDLEEQAFEIVNSMGKVDTAENNRNINEGRYRVIQWNYLTDANNWFMMDSRMRKMHLHWVDRIPTEFAFVEDFDTLIAKWRLYSRYSNSWDDWRWLLGSEVS